MLVKGQMRQANHLAAHLVNAENNEEIRTLEGRNLLDSHDVFDSIEAMRDSAGENLRSCLHAKICPSPEVARRMTDADWQQAADIFIRDMGLERHQVLLVLHTKNDRPHLHLVAGARNLETGRKYNDYRQKRRNMRCQETICREMPHLGDSPCTAGADAAGKPKAGYQRRGREYEQELRTGISAAAVEADLRRLWAATDQNPELFRAAASRKGLVVARGDKALVVIDPAGGVHGLSRRLGMRKAEAERAFAALDIPTAAEVRGHHSERQDRLSVAAGRHRRPWERHTSAWRQIDQLPGVAAGQWDDAARRAWGRQQFLRRRARELGIDLPEVPAGVTGIYRGRDAVTRLHIAATRETLRVSPEYVSTQSRGPGPSDQAVRAMLACAQAQGWKSVTLTGPADYQRRAAREAARRGIPLANASPEIAAAWAEEKERARGAPKPCSRCGRHPCACTAEAPKPTPAGGKIAGYDREQLAALADLGKTLRREQRERIIEQDRAQREYERRHPQNVPVPRPEPPRN